MKTRTPYPALGTLVVLSIALIGALVFLPAEEPRPDERPGNVFSRTENDLGYTLKFIWKDFRGKSLQVTFPLSKQALSEAEEEFGFRQEDLDRHLEAWGTARNEDMILALKDFVRDLIDRSGFGDHIFIEEKGPLEFTLKLSVPRDLQDKVKPAFDAIKSRLTEEHASEAKKIQEGALEEMNRYLERHGLVAEGDRFRVDYRKSVLNNTPRLRGALEALRRINEKVSLRGFLGLSLSFIQDIKYGVPPETESDKTVLGFWVPPKVLVNNLGDCDSKGVTFASLWLNFKAYPMVLIRIPEHMFVGLAIPSWGSEGFVINGLRYTLCEVSPLGKVPPGLVTYYSSNYLKSGRYRYELISR